jgi:hypothetical protein
MRLALVLLGVFTVVVVGLTTALWVSDAQAGGAEDILWGGILAAYIASPWVGALVFAAHSPTRRRLMAMSACSILPTVVVLPVYYDVARGAAAGSTAPLVFAVFPWYHWCLIVISAIVVLLREKKAPS